MTRLQSRSNSIIEILDAASSERKPLYTIRYAQRSVNIFSAS
jgi:hypothetical protein